MSEGMNRVILVGNLGADPELRVTSGGTSVLKLRLACTEKYLDSNNQKQERTEWVNVVIWGKRGEGLSRMLRKGEPLLVEGRMATSSYDKDGVKQYRTEVVATNVVLIGGGKGDGQRPERNGSPKKSEPADFPPDDSDIPF